MHVLLISSARLMTWDSQASAIFLLDQAIALDNRDCKVGILSPAPLTMNLFFKSPKLFFNELLESLKIQNFSQISILRSSGCLAFLPARYFRKLYKNLYISNTKRLWKKYINAYGLPDIVHLHNGWCAGIFAKYLKSTIDYKGKIVLTEHDSEIFKLKKDSIVYRELEKSYNAIDHIVAVSSYQKNNISKQFPDITNFISVIPNVLDKTFSGFSIVNNRVSKNINLISIGNLIKHKNHEMLLEAFEIIYQRNQNIKLTIIGAGPLYEYLQNLTITKKYANSIFIKGYMNRKEIMNELANNEIFVLPSISETFGVVLIEALSMGIPVIAFKGSGPDDIIKNDFNGILVEKFTAIDLANAIEKIVVNFESFDRNSIQKACFENYSSDAVALQLLKIYRS